MKYKTGLLLLILGIITIGVKIILTSIGLKAPIRISVIVIALGALFDLPFKVFYFYIYSKNLVYFLYDC